MQCAQHHPLGIGRPRGLGGVKRGAYFLKLARVEGDPDSRRGQRRVRGDKLGGQGGEQLHRLQAEALKGWRQFAAISRELSASWPRRRRLADRLGGIAVVRVPLRRSPMQYRRPLWCRAGQLMPQQAAEQVVIPEPAVLVVQRDQEQVGAMY